MPSPNPLTWDLESVFPGGSSSPQFADFRGKLKDDLTYAESKLDELTPELSRDNLQQWIDYILLLQDLAERIDHAEGFTGCLCAQDVNDEKALVISGEIDDSAGRWEQLLAGVEEMAARADNTIWSELVAYNEIGGSAFFWNELRRNAKLKMETKLEKLAIELGVNGYHAWNALYTKMAGDLQAEFTQDGKTEVLSMGQLATRFSSPDRTLRKQAFEKLEDSWARVSALASLTLNAQAGFRLSLYKRRGWESAMFEPLKMGRLKKETVDAMWTAVARGAKEMKRYTDAKKKLLGIDNFRWYDQVAPVGASVKKITYRDAGDFVVKHLSKFSPEMGAFSRQAIDNRWIEAEDRSGKAAGGFCTGVDLIKESRIFMTFSGNYDETMTLAHELGHAYHSWIMRDLDFMARVYPLNLAETASTFNELLVTDAALAEVSDPAEKLVLLEQKIQQGFIMFCNIRARYLFDEAFYRERAEGNVSTDRLNELMTNAQKTAFGEILADDGCHPLFWASKLHFFETRVPFYNFPYTFGFLFAGGIYDRAQKEGSKFAEDYRALLADTGSMTTEEVAQKHLGVDLTKEEFWNDAVDRVLGDIDPFVNLAHEA